MIYIILKDQYYWFCSCTLSLNLRIIILQGNDRHICWSWENFSLRWWNPTIQVLEISVSKDRGYPAVLNKFIKLSNLVICCSTFAVKCLCTNIVQFFFTLYLSYRTSFIFSYNQTSWTDERCICLVEIFWQAIIQCYPYIYACVPFS